MRKPPLATAEFRASTISPFNRSGAHSTTRTSSGPMPCPSASLPHSLAPGAPGRVAIGVHVTWRRAPHHSTIEAEACGEHPEGYAFGELVPGERADPTRTVSERRSTRPGEPAASDTFPRPHVPHCQGKYVHARPRSCGQRTEARRWSRKILQPGALCGPQRPGFPGCRGQQIPSPAGHVTGCVQPRDAVAAVFHVDE